MCTRRLPNSMKKSTYSRCSHIVSTVKKSTASRLRRCTRTNSRQVIPPRLPAGPRPAGRSQVRTVVAETCRSPEPDRQRRRLILRSIGRQDSGRWPRLLFCCERSGYSVVDTEPSRSRTWRCVTVVRSPAHDQAAALPHERSTILGPARQGVAGLANGLDRCAARYCRALASPVAPAPLDSTLNSNTSGPPEHRCGFGHSSTR
jgi:hypothetical protein